MSSRPKQFGNHRPKVQTLSDSLPPTKKQIKVKKRKINIHHRYLLLDGYGVPIAPVIEYQIKDQKALELAQPEDTNAGSLDDIVILDNVQSYNLFQSVSQDQEHQSVPLLDSGDYRDQDLLPGDYGDDQSHGETDNSIADNITNDKMKISIGFKVDKTSDIITLLEKDRSINPDAISDQNIPEQGKFQPKDQATVKTKLLTQQDNAEVKKSQLDLEKSPLEFTTDLESLVFRESTLEKLSNVTRIEMFSNVMSEKHEESELTFEDSKNVHRQNSTVVGQQLVMRLPIIPGDRDRGDRNDLQGEIIKNDDVVYILYLSKDGLDDLSDIVDNE